MLAIITGIGCSCSSASDNHPEGTLPFGVPAELAYARLVYHRPDGVYGKSLSGGAARQLVEGASYARWSPDGETVAMVSGHEVLVYNWQTGETRTLARVEQPRAVGFHPDGREVFFTDGQAIRAVHIKTGSVRQVLDGAPFFELDVASDGTFMAATVRVRGWRVRRYELPDGTYREVARGCSAGVSPDGRWIMTNTGGHQRLDLRDSVNGEVSRTLHAPEGHTLNNHKWSNRNEWIAGIVQEPGTDIMAQRVSDGRTWRLTEHGDADRPDLFIP